MPTINEKINEAAHDTGYFAGATKEKVRLTSDHKTIILFLTAFIRVA